MNKLDLEYQALLKDILENGIQKGDRTGTGTISVFGRQLRHRMSDGFPILTTKRVHFKSVVSELLWFLGGRTDLKWLLEQNNTIWVGDAYKLYCKIAGAVEEPDYDIHVDDPNQNCTRLMTKEEFINRIKTDDEFAKKFGELGPIYGKQWRKWRGQDGMIGEKDENGVRIITWNTIDQIANLIRDLKTNPDSRRLMVSAWNVGELDRMVLPPCHYGFQVYTRELSAQERLEWVKTNLPNVEVSGFVNNDEYSHKWVETLDDTIPTRAISLMFNMRSNDVPLGLPFNIASYGLLLEIIAKMVNMVPDELIGNLGDCHIYKNQIDGINEQLTREPFPLPILNINTEFWPTESGECGIGPIDAIAVVNGFSNDNFCKCLLEEDIQLSNYQSQPAIKIPLSN